VELERRLPALLRGQQQPADAGERLTLAWMCQYHKHLHAAAARFFGEAFAAQPALAENLGAVGGRYDAACAAALAGCGQGKDAAGLGEGERARLRRQAAAWLRSDLDAWRRLLAKDPKKAGAAVRKQLRHWLHDADFAGVRGAEALAGLPEAERQLWQQLWADVATTLARAQGELAPHKQGRRQH
jgi:hypothetical protein